jgi:hypothetical protein
MTAVDMMAGVYWSLPVSYLDDPFGAQIPPFTPLHLVVEEMRVFFIAPVTQTALESQFRFFRRFAVSRRNQDSKNRHLGSNCTDKIGR